MSIDTKTHNETLLHLQRCGMSHGIFIQTLSGRINENFLNRQMDGYVLLACSWCKKGG